MTLGEFNALELEERIDAVWEWGFFISKNQSGQFTHVLYSLHDFFTEMILGLGDNKVIEVKAYDKRQATFLKSFEIDSKNPLIRNLDLKN